MQLNVETKDKPLMEQAREAYAEWARQDRSAAAGEVAAIMARCRWMPPPPRVEMAVVLAGGRADRQARATVLQPGHFVQYMGQVARSSTRTIDWVEAGQPTGAAAVRRINLTDRIHFDGTAEGAQPAHGRDVRRRLCGDDATNINSDTNAR